MLKGYRKIICLFLVLVSLMLTGCNKQEEAEYTTVPETTALSLPDEDSDDTDMIYPCPIDFGEYRSVNREVYAYISIPNTNISYPILQSTISDNYYLRRNWKGASSYRGCLFTQSGNSRDFYDPVTVIYGHNTDKGDMFSQLLYFQDKDFFEKNRIFYIYTEERILVYKIISAHIFDDRHILNSYDFGDENVFLDFEEMLLNPPVIEKNVRDNIELDENSCIVTLSTCAQARSGSEKRFLVNGVMIKDVPTV